MKSLKEGMFSLSLPIKLFFVGLNILIWLLVLLVVQLTSLPIFAQDILKSNRGIRCFKSRSCCRALLTMPYFWPMFLCIKNAGMETFDCHFRLGICRLFWNFDYLWLSVIALFFEWCCWWNFGCNSSNDFAIQNTTDYVRTWVAPGEF
jgi:hypothetical protein